MTLDHSCAERHANELYATLEPGAPQIKVALLIAQTWKDEVPAEAIVDSALTLLAQYEDIETFGDISNWRRSEVRRIKP